MDPQKALQTVAKLHLEKDQFHKKKVKAKIFAIICLVVGCLFFIPFIVLTVITFNNPSFTIGVPLFIIFGVLAFIFLEGSIVFFLLMKCVYAYQEENRAKLLNYINNEVNKKTQN